MAQFDVDRATGEDWCDDRFGKHRAGRGYEASRPFDIPWMVMDSRRAADDFGWTPRRSLGSILDEIAAHALEHPEWSRLFAERHDIPAVPRRLAAPLAVIAQRGDSGSATKRGVYLFHGGASATSSCESTTFRTKLSWSTTAAPIRHGQGCRNYRSAFPTFVRCETVATTDSGGRSSSVSIGCKATRRLS